MTMRWRSRRVVFREVRSGAGEFLGPLPGAGEVDGLEVVLEGACRKRLRPRERTSSVSRRVRLFPLDGVGLVDHADVPRLREAGDRLRGRGDAALRGAGAFQKAWSGTWKWERGTRKLFFFVHDLGVHDPCLWRAWGRRRSLRRGRRLRGRRRPERRQAAAWASSPREDWRSSEAFLMRRGRRP